VDTEHRAGTLTGCRIRIPGSPRIMPDDTMAGNVSQCLMCLNETLRAREILFIRLPILSPLTSCLSTLPENKLFSSLSNSLCVTLDCTTTYAKTAILPHISRFVLFSSRLVPFQPCRIIQFWAYSGLYCHPCEEPILILTTDSHGWRRDSGNLTLSSIFMAFSGVEVCQAQKDGLNSRLFLFVRVFSWSWPASCLL